MADSTTTTATPAVKNVFQSKTLWASAAIATLSVAQSYIPVLAPYLNQGTVAFVGVVLAAGLAGLRVFVGTPLTVMPVSTEGSHVPPVPSPPPPTVETIPVAAAPTDGTTK